MTNIYKKRFQNKYFFLSCILIFVISIISYLVTSQFLRILLVQKCPAESKHRLLDQLLYWEFWLSNGTMYNINIFPLYAIIPVIPFYTELKTIFKLGANRFKSRKQELYKSIFTYGILGGGALNLGFYLYLLLGSYLCLPQLSSLGGFESIFHYQLYHQHPFLFLTFMCFTMYFLFGFLFAIMTCGVILCFENRITAILFPMLIYVAFSYLGFGLNLRVLQVSTCTTVFCTEYSTLQCFVPLLSLFCTDLLFIILGVKKNEKIVL